MTYSDERTRDHTYPINATVSHYLFAVGYFANSVAHGL
jgi:hypothetical protein